MYFLWTVCAMLCYNVFNLTNTDDIRCPNGTQPPTLAEGLRIVEKLNDTGSNKISFVLRETVNNKHLRCLVNHIEKYKVIVMEHLKPEYLICGPPPQISEGQLIMTACVISFISIIIIIIILIAGFVVRNEKMNRSAINYRPVLSNVKTAI